MATGHSSATASMSAVRVSAARYLSTTGRGNPNKVDTGTLDRRDPCGLRRNDPLHRRLHGRRIYRRWRERGRERNQLRRSLHLRRRAQYSERNRHADDQRRWQCECFRQRELQRRLSRRIVPWRRGRRCGRGWNRWRLAYHSRPRRWRKPRLQCERDGELLAAADRRHAADRHGGDLSREPAMERSLLCPGLRDL